MLGILLAVMMQGQTWPAMDDEPDIIYLPGIQNPDGVDYVNGDPETTSVGSSTGDAEAGNDEEIKTLQIFMLRSNYVEIDGSELPVYDVVRYLTESLRLPKESRVVLRVNEDVSGSPLTILLNDLREAGFEKISVFIV